VLSANTLLAMAAALGLAAGCHHDAPPARPGPGEVPPLPPSSGTPLGYLIDDADELKLTTDQVIQLKDIDQGLEARLDVLDARSSSTPPTPSAGVRPMRGGKMHGHGGGGGRHARPRGGDGNPHGPPASNDPAQAGAQRMTEVRDALARAFAIMDETQQAAARKLLAAHDIELTPQAGSDAPAPSGSDAPATGGSDATGDSDAPDSE
jgi:hypothetical protein